MSRHRVKHPSLSTQAAAPGRLAWRVHPGIVWGAAAAASLAVVALNPDFRRWLLAGSRELDVAHLRALIAAAGPWAPAASIALMVIHTAVPFPAELLTAANGAVFGFWGGLLVSWLGAMAGGCVGFAIARGLGRSAIIHLIPARAIAPVDATMGSAGWEIALVVRLIPVISFNLINFALGLTRLSWRTFLWTTAVGVLPVEVAVVAVGYGAGGSPRALPWALLALAALTAGGLAVRRRLWSSAERGGSPGAKG